MRKAYLDIDLPQARTIVKGENAVLVDVRENWEFEEFNEGGINIPLANIREKRAILEPFQKIVVICTNGVRSKVAAMDYCRIPAWSEKDIYHVKGGIIESE
jgi:rhodanese-related sulfurtransferase